MFGASVHFPSSTPQPSLMCPGKGVALLRCAGVLWHISPCSCFSAYCYVPPTYVLSLNSRLPFSSLLFLLHPSTTCLSQSLSLSLYARLSGYFWFHSLLERLYWKTLNCVRQKVKERDCTHAMSEVCVCVSDLQTILYIEPETTWCLLRHCYHTV